MSYLRLLLISLILLDFVNCGRLGFDPPESMADAAPPIPPSCFDGLMNLEETGVDCGGTCPPCTVASNCQELLAQTPSTPNGVYRLDPDGDGPIEAGFAYCEMTAEGGGWTLAAKVDGTQSTFLYDSTLWTSADTLNVTSPGMDIVEAKLDVFNRVSFTQLRVGMRHNNDLRWMTFSYSANSLLSVFQTVGHVPIGVSRNDWLNLLSDGYLQDNCNRQGFNSRSGVQANGNIGVRLGIITNNEVDCGTPDAFIGIGYTGFLPGCETTFTLTTTTGNGSTCALNPGNSRNTSAFAYIMVR